MEVSVQYIAENEQYDAFLSYCTCDSDCALRIEAALQAKGIRVWMDRHEIRPGDRFVDALEKGIESSKALVFLISPEALSSSWVKEEYGRALVITNSEDRHRPLIPVILRSATLPGFLSGRQIIDLTNPADFDEAIEALYWGVTGNASRRSPVRRPLDGRQHSAAQSLVGRRLPLLPLLVCAAGLTGCITILFNTAEATRDRPLSAREVSILFVVVLSMFLLARTAWDYLRRRRS